MSDAKYTNHVIEVLDDCLTNLHYNGISEIICYGLGNLSENKQARYQLGLLLCLRKYYDDTPVYVYDPVFSSEEKKILQYFGLQIINRNEEGKRVLKHKTTLMYMPHCSHHLTNNFLYTNWGNQLRHCILLSNSFGDIVCDYRETPRLRKFLPEIRYLHDIAPYVTEIKLKNLFEYDSAFSSQSVHFFTKKKLRRVPIDFWQNREEPQYLKTYENLCPDCSDCIQEEKLKKKKTKKKKVSSKKN